MALRERIAPAAFDLFSSRFEKRDYVTKGRRKLLAAAARRVLEVGAGTGYNLPHFATEAPVEGLPYPDGSGRGSCVRTSWAVG